MYRVVVRTKCKTLLLTQCPVLKNWHWGQRWLMAPFSLASSLPNPYLVKKDNWPNQKATDGGGCEIPAGSTACKWKFLGMVSRKASEKKSYLAYSQAFIHEWHLLELSRQQTRLGLSLPLPFPTWKARDPKASFQPQDG